MKQPDPATGPAAQAKTIDNMNVPPQFTFTMATAVNAGNSGVSGARAGSGPMFSMSSASGITVNGLEGIPFSIYDASPAAGGRILYAGTTTTDGGVTGTFVIPAYLDTVVVVSDYIGVPHEVPAPIVNGTLNFSYASIPVSPAVQAGGTALRGGVTASINGTNSTYVTMGKWDANGVPAYLEPMGDPIDAALLARITASLPEYQSLPINRPQYITPEDKSTALSLAADVYVTFIHEGAGYLNALAYYTYNASNPPKTEADIKTLTIIFPNASYAGSGGGLHSGNKVKLGSFPANTVIGWCVIANGFSNGAVGNGNWKLYSNTALNPEPNAALKQHALILNDVGYDREILSFEDIRRDAGSDNDFNDVVFSITSNPPAAMAQQAATLPVPVGPLDSDGDGVTDAFDAYPHDPLRAFDSFMPAKGTFGTLAFEDLWPGIGDYDFNDMVVDYNIQQVSNAKNDVVEVKATFVLRAVGASFRSGFGFQLPVAPSQIASVTGTHLTSGIVKTLGNGCEAGQTQAVVVVFDDAQAMMRRPGGYYINSQIGAPYVAPDTIKVVVTFTTPVASAVLGVAPYNPFIFVNQERGREVHLVDQPATSLARPSYFDMFADNSNPGLGRYYRTKLNHPWALNFPEQFAYPTEYTSISNAYLNFITWAESGGNTAKDWYKNLAGNRNAALIYHP